MNKKALVVEDYKNIAELLRLYLEKDGFEVTIASDGGAGLRLAGDVEPDVILLDIMLPVMDGWQVCKEIRRTSQVPIIMLTAKGETYDKVTGLEMGADDYVTKPFEVKELIARIHAVMRRADGVAAPTEKKLVYDKLVINLDSYELIVNGKRIDTPPIVSSPATSSLTKFGALTTSATPAPWTYTSNVCVRSSRASRTSGRSRPCGAWATNLRCLTTNLPAHEKHIL